jgi:aflatoxin B1 aldehyde reductase
MESKLLPLLRAHSMVFTAFQPLAGGFLTGKFVQGKHAGTRFSEENPLGKAVQALFGDELLHTAMMRFVSATEAQGVSTTEVALRWLAHHSALRDDDGIVIGASRTAQLVDSVSLIRKGPLPVGLVTLAESIWDEVREAREGIL